MSIHDLAGKFFTVRKGDDLVYCQFGDQRDELSSVSGHVRGDDAIRRAPQRMVCRQRLGIGDIQGSMQSAGLQLR